MKYGFLVAVDLLPDQVKDCGADADPHRGQIEFCFRVAGIDCQRPAVPQHVVQPEVDARNQHEKAGGHQYVVIIKKTEAGIVGRKPAQ